MNDYVGEPPQRRGFGFGRKVFGEAPPPPSDSFTLSAAAQEFIAQDRARRQAEFDTAATMQQQQQAPVPSEPMVNDIDYVIGGADSQYLEVELDPGEAVIAENGAMIWKDTRVCFETILGDGSEKGMFDKIMSAGTNLLGGENMFLGEFRHSGGGGKARLALGGRTPGHVLPVRLEEMGGKLVCKRGAFLAAAKGISVSVRWAGLWTGMEGGEGYILQELSGTGWAFIHVGGTLIERELKDGEQLHVDAGCIAAFEPGVAFDTDIVGGGPSMLGTAYREVKNSLVGGEGWMFARLTGPGKVWIQSLPFRRLSHTVIEDAKKAGDLPGESIFGSDRDRNSTHGSIGLDDIAEGVGMVSKLFK